MLSPNAITVLESRYLLRDKDGNLIETPQQLFRRVANAIVQAEYKFGEKDPGKKELVRGLETKFYEAMASGQFMPNSPTLMNAGTHRQQLSACFVLPVEDSLEGIYNTLKHAALIHQSGGGTGFNFSKIRPHDDFLQDSGGTASGPVSFIELFDASTERIKQGGRRRGANMGILNCDHPDIESFITSKRMPGALRNFNISVGATNAFLDAVEKNKSWQLIHPNYKTVVKEIPAKKLWELIIDNAWSTGDPGMIFLDVLEAANPTPKLGRIDTTNPCGEVPLLAYEACNLGSINLSLFTKEVNGKPAIDFDALKKTISLAVRFLDNVVEENNYILPEITRVVKGNRKIGLGLMGWAELLIMLGIPYASNEATALGERLMKFVSETALEASRQLAVERRSFSSWNDSIYAPHDPVRNATRTAIAPTGTIAVIAGTSPSIEPLYALAFERRNVLRGQTLTEVNEIVFKRLQDRGLLNEKVKSTIIAEGHAENTDLPDEWKELIRTAPFIAPEWHLRHQAAFQKHTDNAVSKTINLPESSTREAISEIYMKAWKLGLKGITVYRDKCKPEQVMNAGAACEICAT
ncbi:MAG TPA: adenosylcobalamin-dependent ribonucleoside-diphosphate reductase [Bacteroidia bacterium]|nr:adenosylcobalamin-dependent ribonucleoside-diphosphate reductase [Bacteroidia bacterium]